jgi:hypothetical protein
LNELRLSLIASNATWAYVWPAFASALSVIVLASFGQALRRRWWPQSGAPFIGVDLAIGWVASTALFTLSSFLTHLVPWLLRVPGLRFFPLLQPLIALCVLCARSRRLPWVPPVWQLLVFVAVTLWHSRAFVFQPFAAGDDVAVIAELVEHTRDQGRFALSVFEGQGTLPDYPFGATALIAAMMSPLHHSAAALHVLPSLAASTLVFLCAGLCAFWLRVPDRLAFFSASVFRVSLLAFEAPFLDPGFDQALKLSLGFLLVLGTWLAFSSRRVAVAAVGFFALGLMTLVNFANAYISLAAALLCLSARLSRARACGALVAICLGVFALAQEPRVVARAHAFCLLYTDVPFCVREEVGTSPVQTKARDAVAAPMEALPAFIGAPWRIFWPEGTPTPVPTVVTRIVWVLSAG